MLIQMEIYSQDNSLQVTVAYCPNGKITWNSHVDFVCCNNFTCSFHMWAKCQEIGAHMSFTSSHVFVHAGRTWNTWYPHVFSRPYMCLTREIFSSRKRVKQEQHMWDTCEHMRATCGFSAIYPLGSLTRCNAQKQSLSTYMYNNVLSSKRRSRCWKVTSQKK